MSIIDQQLEYYRARAAEYDQWFLRQGRYDRGPQVNQRWHKEVALIRAALDDFQPQGEVLELACGTGLWTQQLARHASDILAVDGAAEMLALNRERMQHASVQYEQADIFAWSTSRRFDVVFFGFWLSHVPRERFEPFWETVRSVLKAAGRVFFVDSLPNPASRANDHAPPDMTSDRQTRILNDGRQFEIVKRYYDPAELQEKLNGLGWTAQVNVSGEFHLYGTAI